MIFSLFALFTCLLIAISQPTDTSAATASIGSDVSVSKKTLYFYHFPEHISLRHFIDLFNSFKLFNRSMQALQIFIKVTKNDAFIPYLLQIGEYNFPDNLITF